MAAREYPVGSFSGREGSRWINHRPSSDEVADWFEKNVPLHEGMDPAKYVGGLTLISSSEVVSENRNGSWVKVKNQVLTPYCKVDTRVKYFWDLMILHPEWTGIIEPVNHWPDSGLPPGFFHQRVEYESKTGIFVCCTQRVRVLRDAQWIDTRPTGIGPKLRVLEGIPVVSGPPATKQIPILTTAGWGNDKRIVPDPYGMMKAETGAVGRALGLAGMLVVPGTGIATAEDMQEAHAQGDVPTGGDVSEATLPEIDAPDTVTLASEVEDKLTLLQDTSPLAHKAFQEWAKERFKGKPLADLTDGQLRGVERKLASEITKAETSS